MPFFFTSFQRRVKCCSPINTALPYTHITNQDFLDRHSILSRAFILEASLITESGETRAKLSYGACHRIGEVSGEGGGDISGNPK